MLVPADHGPAKAPKIPRAATVARNNSVSNHSATRSATAIGPQRSSRYASFFPSPRNERPSFPRFQSSPALGFSIAGGVIVSNGANTLPMRAKLF